MKQEEAAKQCGHEINVGDLWVKVKVPKKRASGKKLRRTLQKKFNFSLTAMWPTYMLRKFLAHNNTCLSGSNGSITQIGLPVGNFIVSAHETTGLFNAAL